MNIALLGYGKMGKLIEKIATQSGHSISYIANSKHTVYDIDFSKVDVAIDFSTPKTAFNNISTALTNGVPVVCGTTGWLEKMKNINKLAIKHDTAFLYASNFSIGVNLFFELNKKLKRIMEAHPQYKSNIKEIHHTEKLDAPSGTALSLQFQIDKNTPIDSQRIKDVPGTHIVNYISDIDTISISHEAHNRNGFAKGAIMAAEWIVDKKGIFKMSDILKL
ncbi:MAG: 4-hydroxy-tetrahydrodipicolinate reductase [Flavobacteriales bacterium]|nr:4-hydroxy-tetrahydrodipicolinate reductase [Flavobacteriales bacterium]MBL6873320.1 4-hydroxy-tetrahydrodipicolinate reductase [Flavobacteriales bacterium]